MNVPMRTPDHDPETGEITTGLPVGYQSGNQSLAISIARAEVDQQIATAHAFPRSVDSAVKNILSLATLDEETAAECVYALPRGGKPIKGPSIRLAEIIQSQWGNNRVGTRVVHVDRIEKYVEAEGVFHDLETNAATTARVRRRISDKKGQLLTDDMIIVTGNAASSIAKRNAILGGVPKAVWRKAYAAVERVIAGDVKTLAVRRTEAMKAFAAFGVTPEQVFAALDVHGLDDIALDHMATLVGMHSALKSGEASVEEMFPPNRPKGDDGPKDIGSRLNALAGEDEGSKDEPEKKPAGKKTATAEPAEEQKTEPGENASNPTSGSASDGKQDVPSSASAAKPSSGASPSPGGGTPSQADARAAGADARERGMSRKAVPAEYRKEPLLTAFYDGFDTGEAEDNEPGADG